MPKGREVCQAGCLAVPDAAWPVKATSLYHHKLLGGTQARPPQLDCIRERSDQVSRTDLPQLATGALATSFDPTWGMRYEEGWTACQLRHYAKRHPAGTLRCLVQLNTPFASDHFGEELIRSVTTHIMMDDLHLDPSGPVQGRKQPLSERRLRKGGRKVC